MKSCAPCPYVDVGQVGTRGVPSFVVSNWLAGFGSPARYTLSPSDAGHTGGSSAKRERGTRRYAHELPRSWRPHIEGALRLNLSVLLQAAFIAPNSQRVGVLEWKNRDGEVLASLKYASNLSSYDGRLVLGYQDGDQPRETVCVIPLSTTPLNFGGRRWWMHCPYTHRRATLLYKFGPIEFFCHRMAIRPLPTYASQRVSGVDRIIDQRWRIRRKLSDDFSSLFDHPLKPKRMRWRTFQRHANRDEALAEAEDRSMLRRLSRVMHRAGLDN
jgi:hypothetical protein